MIEKFSVQNRVPTDGNSEQQMRGRTLGGFTYIPWGSKNFYPEEFQDCCHDSSTQMACSTLMFNRIKGKGYNIKDNEGFTPKTPNPEDDWDDLLDSLLSDFILFDGFAYKVVMARNGDINIYHQPFAQVRLGKNGTQSEGMAGVCVDWRSPSYWGIEQIPLYNGTIEPGTTYLVYAVRLKNSELYYHIPDLNAGLRWIDADRMLARYYDAFVSNSMTSNKVIKFPYELDENKKIEVRHLIDSIGCGADNGGNFLVMDGCVEQQPVVESLSVEGADLYDQTADIVQRKICTVNNLASPTLAGISVSSGFSSQAEEYLAASTIYELNKVAPTRAKFIKSVNKMLNRFVNIGIYNYALSIDPLDVNSAFNYGVDTETDDIETDTNSDKV